MRGYDEATGKQYSAGEIIKAAETLQLKNQLDRIMIEKIVNELKNNDHCMAVNISTASLNDSGFLEWLSTFVKSIDSNLGARLIIEVPELMLTRYQELLRELGALLKPKNIRLGVDHVGLNLASLQYLSALPIEYLKIDSSLTQVFNQENAEFLLNNLCNIAHVLDVQVIASYVESEALLNRLQSLEIDGLQGVAVSPVEYP